MQLPAIRRPLPQVTRPLRRPLSSLVDLAALIRHRLADTLLGRPDGANDHTVPGPAPDAVIVAAAAPFAATSFARARLLRQMHAAGLLSPHETEQAEQLFGVAQSG
ncbi:MAG TPA: hypothetical protein VIG48_05085 [Jatrophihabitans sp.]|jgi:hypothetical protein